METIGFRPTYAGSGYSSESGTVQGGNPGTLQSKTHFHGRPAELQIPPLRYPGFPVDLGGVGALHAPFSYRKAHTRLCPAQRGRKSGYAPVGMTMLFGKTQYSFQDELSSRPECRAVERFAADFLRFSRSSKGPLLLRPCCTLKSCLNTKQRACRRAKFG
jgi:hypothetical protein